MSSACSPLRIRTAAGPQVSGARGLCVGVSSHVPIGAQRVESGSLHSLSFSDNESVPRPDTTLNEPGNHPVVHGRGCCVDAGGVYGVTWLLERRPVPNLLFCLTSPAVADIARAELGMMHSATLAEFAPAAHPDQQTTNSRNRGTTEI